MMGSAERKVASVGNASNANVAGAEMLAVMFMFPGNNEGRSSGWAMIQAPLPIRRRTVDTMQARETREACLRESIDGSKQSGKMMTTTTISCEVRGQAWQ